MAYEAGPTGFDLARQLTAAGVRCVVAAPSKLQRPAADRIKTDRDALHMARLLRMDEIVEVRVPSVEQEATRDLVRAREDVRGDLMRYRHRLSKLPLRHGIVYSGGTAWTAIQETWLRRQLFPHRCIQLAFDADLEAMLLTVDRRNRLDKAMADMAADGEYAPLARRLSCLRGVAVLTANRTEWTPWWSPAARARPHRWPEGRCVSKPVAAAVYALADNDASSSCRISP